MADDGAKRRALSALRGLKDFNMTTPWQTLFFGREDQLQTLHADWQQVKRGEPCFRLILGETGLGKTRLVQRFYQQISDTDDPDHYWPDNLGTDNGTNKVNPDFSERLIRDKPISWLWWGVRFQNPHNRNALERMGCQIQADAHAIAPHLYSLQQYKEKKTRNANRIKQALMATGSLLGLGVFEVVVNELALTLPGLADNVAESVRRRQQGCATGSEVEKQQQLDALKLIREYLEALMSREDKKISAESLPVILWLDDAQWADADSLAFVEKLFAQAKANKWPLYVIAVHWEREWREACAAPLTSPDLRPHSLAALCRRNPLIFPAQSGEELPPLTAAQSQDLIHAALPGLSAAQQQAMVMRTQGNPGFLHDLLAHLSARERKFFVRGERNQPLSPAGEHELAHILTLQHHELTRYRYETLDTALQELLSWSSYQGETFFEVLTLSVAARLQPEYADKAWLDQAEQRYALIRRLAQFYQAQFKHPAMREIALEELRHNPAVLADFQVALRATLVEDYQTAAWQAYDLPVQLHYLQLLQRELAGEAVYPAILDDLFDRYVQNQQPPQAADVGQQRMALALPEDLHRIRRIAKVCADVGAVQAARRYYQQAAQRLDRAQLNEAGASLLLYQARLQQQDGEIDTALTTMQQVAAFFAQAPDQHRAHAVTLGDIARIKVDKGEVDAALKLHEERLEVFQALGDARSRAVTLHDLARIALYHQEKPEKALEYWAQAWPVFRQLGDAMGVAVIGENLGTLLWRAGERETAPQILQHSAAAYRLLGQEENARAVEGVMGRAD